MRSIKYVLFTFLISIIGITYVCANTIYSIDVKLKLDEYGNGYVTEVWDAKVDKGTELYKPMGDLGNSEITNYEVSMDGTKYTYVSNWDTSASKSEKAYKNGINYTSSGFELCFGMSSYGRHKYVLTYNVSNMIYNTDDSQFLYWKFINDSMDPAPFNISVKVVGPYAFPSVNENVDAYTKLLDTYIADINASTKNEDFEASNYVAPDTETVKCGEVLFTNNEVSTAYNCKVKGSKYTYEYYDYLGSTVSLADSVAVWGYGYDGYVYASNGAIEMINEENNFKSSEYVVLLARFKKDTFKTANTYGGYNDFGDVYGRSKYGSFSYTEYKEPSFFEKLISTIITLIPFIFTFGIAAIGVLFSRSGSYDKGTVDIKNANPFRDIPCNGDILNAYFLSKVYNLYKKKEDLFGAVILKWVLDGTVKIKEEEKQGVFKTKKIISLDMTRDYQDPTPCGKLYKILKTASKDGILESNELEKYCQNNYDKLYNWFNEVEEYVKDSYTNSGLITKGKKGNVIKYTAYFIEPKLQEEALHLAGLKKFLKEVSLIHEKRPIEVHLWKEYLMFAQIFGMAKEVAENFKDLYPEILKDMSSADFDYTTFVIINNFQTSTVRAMSSARSAAQSYSSGGGGFSSGGGGGGSFGGGSGGGCR